MGIIQESSPTTSSSSRAEPSRAESSRAEPSRVDWVISTKRKEYDENICGFYYFEAAALLSSTRVRSVRWCSVTDFNEYLLHHRTMTIAWREVGREVDGRWPMVQWCSRRSDLTRSSPTFLKERIQTYVRSLTTVWQLQTPQWRLQRCNNKSLKKQKNEYKFKERRAFFLVTMKTSTRKSPRSVKEENLITYSNVFE